MYFYLTKPKLARATESAQSIGQGSIRQLKTLNLEDLEEDMETAGIFSSLPVIQVLLIVI
jgi:hypothetical protein